MRKVPQSLTDITQQLMSIGRGFPNLTTIADYEYSSQQITLRKHSLAEVLEARTNSVLAVAVLPVIAHELTHWLDHVGTVWGQEHLELLFAAFAAREKEAISDYPIIPRFLRALKRLHFEEYYTRYDEGAFDGVDRRPWKFQFTAGLQFDAEARLDENLPIAFTQFIGADEVRICRVPFSLASLLEVNAVAIEMAVSLAAIHHLPDASRKSALHKFTAEYSMLPYEPLRAVYHVAAHLVANRLSISDPLEAYSKAHSISTYCLNLPPEFIEGLVIPDEFAPWQQRNEAFKRQRDRAFVFFALIHHGHDLAHNDIREWLEQASAMAGLPKLRIVEQRASELIHASPATVHSQRLIDLREVARQLWAEPDVAGINKANIISHMLATGERLPAILLEDGTFLKSQVGWSLPTFTAPKQWLEEALKCMNRLRELGDACTP